MDKDDQADKISADKNKKVKRPLRLLKLIDIKITLTTLTLIFGLLTFSNGQTNDNIKNELLSTKINNSGRSIGEQFLHINIRCFWIGKVGEKFDLKLDKKYVNDKKQLFSTLQLSSQKMKETLFKIFEQETIKGYNPHPIAFFTQMIAHESHHQGQIMETVPRNGLQIDKSVNFGLWNWNNK